MLLLCPMNQRAAGFNRVAIAPKVRVDGVAKFNTTWGNFSKVRWMRPAMEANMPDHVLTRTQNYRAQRPLLVQGVTIEIGQAQADQILLIKPFWGDARAKYVACSRPIIL
ncbi:MAG: hypothetical protein OHK0023_24270 [Anaerolineae bacterium]